MTEHGTIDQHAVERFLYHEARLLDEGRLDEWLALFTADAYYWIPCNANDVDPARHVSLIYDDRQHLADRVWRLKSGWAHAQDPPSHTRRIVGNVEPRPAEGEDALVVSSTFILVELRRGLQTLFAGRYEHRLRQDGDGWRIAFKKVELLNNNAPIDSLTFIV
jgi:3-phenylpropionate/cinnamic acid dioxygenase small subunit